MNSFARACGIAAAALALCATATFADPLIASETVPGSTGTTYLAHAEATIGNAAAEANGTDTQPSQAAAEPAETAAHGFASMVADAMQAAAAIMPGALPLDALVEAYSAPNTADAQQECLARAVYFEARGEPIEGQLAVAEVVLNRAASGRYPARICDVVTQPAQFSFIRNGRFPEADRNSTAWYRAVGIAQIAQRSLAAKLSRDVLWYHADYVAPVWGKRLQRRAKIGLHIFYS